MFVQKRDGRKEPVDFSKITNRIKIQANTPAPLLLVQPEHVAQKVIAGMRNGSSTKQLDEASIKICNTMSLIEPEYSTLGIRIFVDNMHKNVPGTFSEAMEKAYSNYDGEHKAQRVNKEFINVVRSYKTILNEIIKPNRDHNFTNFGLSTLVARYLLKSSGPKELVDRRPQDYIIETPQYMWLRASLAIYMKRTFNLGEQYDECKIDELRYAKTDINKVTELYNALSTGKLMLATPSLYNLGTQKEQSLSCFLVGSGDSIDEIGETYMKMMKISQCSGGIGFRMKCRSNGTEVKSTNGTSNGIVPFLRSANELLKTVNQGGKRPGSGAIYIEPHHPDFMDVVTLRRPSNVMGVHELFYAIWMSDLFMRAVEKQQQWYFFDVTTCPELYNSYGDEYAKHYREAVEAKKYIKSIPALDMWRQIIKTQIESGMPYILYKDACNEKSNQKNIGVIDQSNLCAEIIEYSSAEETACCVVATIPLSAYVKLDDKGKSIGFDFDGLKKYAGLLTQTMDRVIDINKYPTVNATKSNRRKHDVEIGKLSNLRHRPLALGIQGLADVFALMKIPFTSDKAKQLNKDILESMYYGCVTESCNMAKDFKSYSTYKGSPASEGKLQFDLWNVEAKDLSGRCDWVKLKENIALHGLRNSLLTSLPPTATSSQIASTKLGQSNSACFEPITSNLYARKTIAGEFVIKNMHMIRDLQEHKLWTGDIMNKIIANRGSIQDIDEIPPKIKDLYKTVWEMKLKDLIDMAADRSPFIDQSQSLNQWMEQPTFKKLNAMHFYCWKKGLKTGMYYLHSKSASKPIQFSQSSSNISTTDKSNDTSDESSDEEATGEGILVCTREKGCVSCSA